MVGCSTDQDCPFLSYCTQQTHCVHKPIFPLQWYSVLIYLLLPIGAGFVNVAGKSMGLLKTTILMNFLRYTSSEATVLVQPMVAGSALPNVIAALFKKHPFLNTSLIDYDIILIIIPCSLLGSTLGSFLQQLIPQIIKDVAMTLFFIFFAYGFYKKAKSLTKQSSQQNTTTPNQTLLQNSSSNSTQFNQQLQSDINFQQLKKSRQKILRYQQSIHLHDILISLQVFLLFQFLVFLVQGKFGFYYVKVCEWQYILGLALLVAIVIGYIQFIRRILFRKYTIYHRLKIRRNLDFSVVRNVGLICFGGYFAGLCQGILGVGSGTFIMGVFMAINLDPRVAAATSCYQILFIGVATFIQQFIMNKILLQDAIFLFLLISIGGGLFTHYLHYRLKKYQHKNINRSLVYIMFTLCTTSAIFIIPYLIQNIIDYGINFLIEIPFHC